MPSLNGAQVIAAHVAEPATGLWMAAISVQVDEVPTDSQTLEIEGVEWTGTVLRSVMDFETASVFLVGGSAKLGDPGKARHFVFASVRSVVSGILGASGDTVSSDSCQTILGALLASYHSSRESLGLQLSNVIGDGNVWYSKRDGQIAIRPAGEFAEFTGEDSEIFDTRENALEESVSYTVTTPDLGPRLTYDGHDITHVDTRLSPDSLTQTVFY